ncbi:MCP four helix bundle domain-containing protein [Bacillus sp. FSL K6-0138]|uniref:MCP four helix bundle domain-containing protein n=1 Tax=Bacillus sp. FSL K6-0138 TaxID=2921422 RepID=UPI0030ED25B2
MNLLKNIKIRGKLFIIILLSAIALLIVGLQGINGLNKISKGSEAIYQGQLVPNQLFSKLRANNLEIDANNFELMVTEDDSINDQLQKDVEKKKRRKQNRNGADR